MTLRTRYAVLGGALLALGFWALNRPQEPPRSQKSMAHDSVVTMSHSAIPERTLYKWRDEKGVWNYSDRAPADRQYERITGTPNVTSVPTVVPDPGLLDSRDPSPP